MRLIDDALLVCRGFDEGVDPVLVSEQDEENRQRRSAVSRYRRTRPPRCRAVEDA